MKYITNTVIFTIAVSIFCSCNRTVAVAPPTMGWSSWNAYEINISDSIIRRQADMLVERGLSDAGYKYVNIDDGYFGGRNEDGSLKTNPAKFPDGMRGLVDYIHSLGLKAGIYSDGGDNTCGSMGNNDPLGFGVGLYGHEAQDANLFFNDWDFDFIKIDYCGGRHVGLVEQDQYTKICHTIDSVAHKKVVINICRWNFPGTWVRDISDSWRISGDIRPKWSTIKHIVELNMYYSAYAGDGHYNDMDMLVVGYNGHPCSFKDEGLGLSYQEEEAHFGMWCIMSSPLLLGCVVEDIPDETMAIISNPELIAVNQDPLGLQACIVGRRDGAYVFTKDLLEKNGTTRAVALYNPEDSDVTIAATPEMLCLEGPLQVRDLNRREELGKMETIEMTLPAHSARILKVTGRRRTEQSRYEAEWGYCPVFDNTKPPLYAKYITYEPASGWAMVANVGGSEDNILCWNDVNVNRSGCYRVEFTLLPGASVPYPAGEDFDSVTVCVNGENYTIGGLKAEVGGPDSCEKATGDSPAAARTLTASIDVNLHKGVNTISIGNSNTVLPPVDKMVVTRL